MCLISRLTYVLFNSFEFVFLFLPIMLITFLCFARESTRYWLLIAASLFFYAYAGREHAYVLVGSVTWVYIFIDRKFFSLPKAMNLCFALAGPLLALIYYKYSKFIIYDIFGAGTPTGGGAFSIFDSIVLPAGISFFTFQLLAYAVDRHTKKIANPIGFRQLLLFISFFPQLIAGPIVRYEQVSGAMQKLGTYALDRTRIIRAIIYVVFGLAFKVLIADTLGNLVEPMIATPSELGLSGVLALVFSYTFQIYFDFYGYSLCAIGLACLFGFDLPDNFRRPYSTLNPKVFWQCWHVTLSYWIRDYLYFPLGGNSNYKRNILIVFLVCGLWHGAGYSFVIWGAYHALLVAGYSLVKEPWGRIPRPIQWVLNFSLVSFGWLFFIFDLSTMWIALNSISEVALSSYTVDLGLIYAVAIAASVCFFVRTEAIADYFSGQRAGVALSMVFGSTCAFLLVLTILFFDRSASFIYFRF